MPATDSLAEAELRFRRALDGDPSSVEAARGLSDLLEKTDREREALDVVRAVAQRRPDDARAHRCHGLMAYTLNQLEEAATSLRRVLELDPDDASAFATLDMCHRYQSFWDGHAEREARVLELTRRHLAEGRPCPVRPYEAMFYPFSAEEHLAIGGSVSERHWRSKRVERERLGLAPATRRGPKLKLGYLSPDFRNNAVAHLTRGMFSLHDRERFEVYAYSTGPDDDGEHRRAIAAACDRFHDLRNASDQTVARRIHDDGVQVLVDLAGHTWYGRPAILALRPAPVQVNWLYPGTMGAALHDYLVGDPVVTPPAARDHFGEAIAALPDSYLVYDHEQQVAEEPSSRSAAGLPETGTVFCAFHKPPKLTPELWDVWMRILEAVPGSWLWLNAYEPESAEALARETAARGVDPERLIFREHCALPRYIAHHRHADLFLDAPLYNAHTTAGHALFAGLPVLTCTGSVFSSRVATSLVRAAGLPELATSSLEDYEARAIELGRDPDALRHLRTRLEANRESCALFDTPRTVRHLEQLFLRMWERRERGDPPAAVSIPSPRSDGDATTSLRSSS